MNNGTHKNSATFVASANLSRGVAVKLTSADATKIEACADADAIGVTLDDVKAGDIVGVALLGVANSTLVCKAGEAFAAGSKLCLGSGGVVKKVPAAGAQAQNVVIIGKALTPSNADGDTVEIIHHCPRAETIAAA
ncbi:MAG: DUF2190 family protein [Opitutales bacterium]|nr:DUF2190 family protein [Opitutales bacterium]